MSRQDRGCILAAKTQMKTEGPHKLSQKSFNMLDAIIEHDDLCLVIATFMQVHSFLTLYSVSKAFFYAVNKHHTAYMTALARYHAPGAEQAFPWRFYRSLCTRDPSAQHHRHLYHDGGPGDPALRMVPSLRWVQMVAHREKVVRQIIAILLLKGQRLPSGTNPTLKKLWLLLDLPTTALRVAAAQNRAFLADRDLLRATLFFVKLDMAFSNPISSRGQTGARRMLLAQRSLTPLRDVLAARNEARGYLNVVRTLARWWPHAAKRRRPGFLGFSDADSADSDDSDSGNGDASDSDSDDGDNGERLLGPRPLPRGRDADREQDEEDGRGTFFGIPRAEVGSLGLEGWDEAAAADGASEPRALLAVDELVMREGIRRGLRLQRWYVDFVMWGYVDPRSGREVRLPAVVEELRAKWIEHEEEVRKEKEREEMEEGARRERQSTEEWMRRLREGA